MLNSKDLFRDLRKRITLVQEVAETDSQVYLILEHVVNLTRSDILAQKAVSVTASETSELDSTVERLNRHEPLQYILGHAYFYGRDFSVNPAVLIPRPETELLVEEVLRHASGAPGKILDIGTGSGCIAITLAKELPQKQIMAFDISGDALQTAQANAKQLGATVSFQRVDILQEEIAFQDLECIVSNPPYVAVSEKETMNRNVLDHEPHVALFVRDDDPLVFYKAIAAKGWKALPEGGRVVVEINERFGKEVCAVFIQAGYSRADIIQDLQGKDRIVTVMK